MTSQAIQTFAAAGSYANEGGHGVLAPPLQWLHDFITYSVLCYVLYWRFLKYLHVVCCVLSVSSKDDDDVDDADDDSPQN